MGESLEADICAALKKMSVKKDIKCRHLKFCVFFLCHGDEKYRNEINVWNIKAKAIDRSFYSVQRNYLKSLNSVENDILLSQILD